MKHLERDTLIAALDELEALMNRIRSLDPKKEFPKDYAMGCARAFGRCTSIADMALFQVNWIRFELKLPGGSGLKEPKLTTKPAGLSNP